jgi:hypothetical protein
MGMPKIIVISEHTDGERRVTLEERVEPLHLEDEHSAAQLVERVGWAILDAEQVEATIREPREPLPRHYASPVTDWAREAGSSLAA